MFKAMGIGTNVMIRYRGDYIFIDDYARSWKIIYTGDYNHPLRIERWIDLD